MPSSPKCRGRRETRLRQPCRLSGYPFRLVDTAGLRETGERVEALGIEVARRYLARADLVLYCAERGEGLSAADSGVSGGM